MRTKLAASNDIRDTFTATFVKYGTKNGWKGAIEKTLLFSNVRDKDGNIVTGHLWFTSTKGFEVYTFKAGDKVEFDARVKEYTKGYKGYHKELYNKPLQKDYRLSHPTKIKKLE